MTEFPINIASARSLQGEYRAGGIDLQERHRTGRSLGPIVDLTRIDGLDGIEQRDDGSVWIGALTTMRTVVTDPTLQERYGALTDATGIVATPQVRAVGTIGGNLLQTARCWYYRNPHFECFRTGGDGCPARDGNHLFHVVVDQGPCVAPHPTTVGMALLNYDATTEVSGGEDRPLAELFGDGSDPTRSHLLNDDEILTGIVLPANDPGDRTAYFRSISRHLAEWPLVEVSVRLRVRERIELARVAVGGVANTPLRLPEVEEILESAKPTLEALKDAAAAATRRTQPLARTGYKVTLLRNTVLETLERALAGSDG